MASRSVTGPRRRPPASRLPPRSRASPGSCAVLRKYGRSPRPRVPSSPRSAPGDRAARLDLFRVSRSRRAPSNSRRTSSTAALRWWRLRWGARSVTAEGPPIGGNAGFLHQADLSTGRKRGLGDPAREVRPTRGRDGYRAHSVQNLQDHAGFAGVGAKPGGHASSRAIKHGGAHRQRRGAGCSGAKVTHHADKPAQAPPRRHQSPGGPPPRPTAPASVSLIDTPGRAGTSRPGRSARRGPR